MLTILTEKPSAAQNFAKALGGMTGVYNGQDYQIVASRGHLLEFPDVHEMVAEDKAEEYKTWALAYLPWNLNDISWRREPKKFKDRKTGKTVSQAGLVSSLKKDIQNSKDGVVIATDVDPSGEGELIAWEILNAIHYKGKVYRMYFTDEAVPSIQKAFKEMKDVSDQSKDGDYLKAEARSRFDFASMQLVRVATIAARDRGYNMVVRQGRLKSVMVKLVADQVKANKEYKKTPYYEVKFKDENGHVFTKKGADRYPERNTADVVLEKFHSSLVQIDGKQTKTTAPGKLLDLGGLASILATQGFKTKEVEMTYQKMYEAQVVSYPRTEDKFISTEQYKEMLPLVDKIAGVVDVDTSLLTHRTPRKTHVKDGGAHGANRPGTNIPSSLNSLTKYGKSGPAIYELLAKNFLAMFAEDYQYESIFASLVDYSDYKTTVNTPLSLGFKAVFDSDASLSDDKDDDDNTSKLGKSGKPFVHEGFNKRPAWPTIKWLNKQLETNNVGTGATRTGTISEVTNGKTALLSEKRGKLDVTKIGEVSAHLLEGSYIADVKVTEKLFNDMNRVGRLELAVDDAVNTITDIVEHDKEVFIKNAQTMPKGDDDMERKPKANGVYAPTGDIISFNKVWAGHNFTQDEIDKLLAGQTIKIEANKKDGGTFIAEGRLKKQQYKGRDFIGFAMLEADDYTIDNAPFPKQWAGYVFTADDEVKLRNGESIHVEAVSKKGNNFEADLYFGKEDGRWKIIPKFAGAGDPNDYTAETAPFPQEWSGHIFTAGEERALRNGEVVTIDATSKRTGNDFTVDVTFQIGEYNGRKSWKIVPDFS